MIVKNINCYEKSINKIGNTYYGKQYIRVTKYLLLGILPVFITKEVTGGDYEKLK